MAEPIEIQARPLEPWMHERLVGALVDVGCPADLARQTVDRHGEIEVGIDPSGADDVYVVDVGRGWTPGLPPEAFDELARDIAADLAERNTELRARAVRGERVSLYWPLRRVASGQPCPESGYWIADGVDRAPEAFALGNLMPTLFERTVTWHLIQ